MTQEGSVLGACATIDDARRLTQREVESRRRSIADLEGKIKAETILLDQAAAKAERLRLAILDLDPDFKFGDEERGVYLGSSAIGYSDLEQSHKTRYGKLARLAEELLREIGSGTFQQVVAHARATRPDLTNATDAEFVGLRGALHGLSKRQNRRVSFTPGENNEGGVFTFLDHGNAEK